MDTQIDINKMKGFVLNLLSNDKMNGFPPLLAEKQVIAFVRSNPQQFQAILTSDKLYPDLPVQESFNLFRKVLTDFVVDETIKFLENTTFPGMKFSFLNKFQQIYDETALKSQIINFLKLLLKNQNVREQFISTLNLLQYNFVDKYITKIYERKEYGYNELYKVSQLGLTLDESVNLLKFLSFFRIIVFMAVPIDKAKKKNINYFSESATFDEKKQYLKIVLSYLKQKISNVNETIFLYSIYSFLPAEKVKLDFSFSRVSSILGQRALDFVPVKKLDKGADTPDKSWFNIARKNYDLYGFDFKLVEEFFKIAADEGW